jgi:hypothetical protein
MPDIRDQKKDMEIFGVEEALAKISTELLNPSEQKLFTVTDVTPNEIFLFPLLKILGDRFKSASVPDFIKTFLLLRISRLRLGRKEFVLMSSGLREIGEDKKRKTGLKDFFTRM